MKLVITLAVLLIVFGLICYSDQFGSKIDQSNVCLFDSDESPVYPVVTVHPWA